MNEIPLTSETRALADASPDALLVVDGGGTIHQTGGEVVRLLGRRAEDLLGATVTRVLDRPSAERLVRRLDEMTSGSADESVLVLERLVVQRPDGTGLPAEALLVPLEATSAGMRSVLVTIRDNTRSEQRRQAEQRARQQLESSNRDLEVFASVAAHDLQEPLRKIRSFSDRLRSAIEMGATGRGTDYLDRIDGSAARMQLLIDDLLALARISGQEPSTQALDIGELARQAGDELTSSTHTDARVEVEDIPPVEGDPVQIRQLLHNLIGNGLKFTRPDVPPLVRVGGERDREWVVVTVSDNGIGFDNRYAERIFRPFERLHGRSEYEGSGVGLTLCRVVAHRHGGTLTAHGTPEEGATFTVRLPFAGSS